MAYSLTLRLTGSRIADVWRSLTSKQQHSATAQLAQMMRELHRWSAPEAVVTQVEARPHLCLDTAEGICGSDINPLPLSRVLALVPHVSQLQYVDVGVVRETVAAINALSPLGRQLDDASLHGVLHGDIHLVNLWLSEDGTVVLSDFEWCASGRPIWSCNG